jgi:hypothetical protein
VRWQLEYFAWRGEFYQRFPNKLAGAVTRLSQGGAPDGADPNERLQPPAHFPTAPAFLFIFVIIGQPSKATIFAEYPRSPPTSQPCSHR